MPLIASGLRTGPRMVAGWRPYALRPHACSAPNNVLFLLYRIFITFTYNTMDTANPAQSAQYVYQLPS